jgi:hypothetical protein
MRPPRLVGDPVSSAQDARERARLAMALRPGDARTRFLVALRRARGSPSGRLPLFLDLRHRATLAAHAVGGWWSAGAAGIWTDGPTAQLLVVPNEAPRGNAVVEFDVGGALVSPGHPTQTVTADINGAAEARWTFTYGEPWEPRRFLIVPGAAVEHMGGFLITLRIHAPHALPSLSVSQGAHSVGIALRSISVWAASGRGPT